MLIVIGHARAKHGCRDQLIEATKTVVESTRGDEGVEVYSFGIDVTDPDVVLSVEVWRDRPSLDTHFAHEHTEAFIATVGGLVAGEPEMSFFTADSLDPAGATS